MMAAMTALDTRFLRCSGAEKHPDDAAVRGVICCFAGDADAGGQKGAAAVDGDDNTACDDHNPVNICCIETRSWARSLSVAILLVSPLLARQVQAFEQLAHFHQRSAVVSSRGAEVFRG